MNCQYCGKIFRRDYNLRRHEDEYCPNRDNDGKEYSPPVSPFVMPMRHMARNFGHARAVNIQTWENLKQYGYTKL